MPGIAGRFEVNLTVRDPAASASWYRRLLGLEELYDHTSDDGRIHYVALVEPKTELVLCLVGHAHNRGEPFSEFRTGSTTSSSWWRQGRTSTSGRLT